MNGSSPPRASYVVSDFIKAADSPALFAGSGVGVRAGLPSWGEFLMGLANVAEPYQPLAAHLIRDRVAREQYLAAATTYKTCVEVPESERYQSLGRPFTDPPSPTSLNALVSIPFRAYFTTNYDRSLHHAYASVKRRAPIAVEVGDPSMRAALFMKEAFIARIHGRAEVPETMVVDESDYARIQADDDYLDLLRHALLDYSLLFVGFSFLDPAIDNILRLIRDRFSKAMPSVHVALLPADASPALDTALASVNIHVVRYSASDEHAALWSGISQSASLLSEAPTPLAVPLSRPLANIHRFLGASYARAKIAGDIGPLRDMVIDGLVTRFLLDAGEGGLTVGQVTSRLEVELGLPANDAEKLAGASLRTLTTKGICDSIRDAFAPTKGVTDFLARDLGTLAQGVLDRAHLREGLPLGPSAAEAVAHCLEHTLILRSWDLGAHYAGSDTITDPPDVMATAMAAVAASGLVLTHTQQRALALAVNDLFQRPDDTESAILAEIGRLAFGLQIALNLPAGTLIHRTILPDAIYLDANVLMPALLDGHPFHAVYVDAMSRLQEAANLAGIALSVRVGRGFLNEVISHMELAKQDVRALGLEDPDELERFVLLYGAENTNVFVSAYASRVSRLKRQVAFQEFLAASAPYSNEGQLAQFVEQQGIAVVPLLPRGEDEASSLRRIRAALASAYDADQPAYSDAKPTILIDHEASQLAALQVDAEANVTSLFISADLRLRRLASSGSLSHLGHRILSHRGLIQLIDLLVGLTTDARSLTRLLWSRPQTEPERVLRDYFISKALKTFDEAQILSMPDVLDRIVAEASHAAREERVTLFPTASADRKADAAAFLDRFEDRFYSYMREQILRGQQSGEG